METLSTQASSRVADVFRPKTRRAYTMMFRVFIAFCVVMKVSLASLSVKVVLSFLECLFANKCPVSMICNYVSAIKANFIVYDLPFETCIHPKVKYFIKSLKINRPLKVSHHNIVDVVSYVQNGFDLAWWENFQSSDPHGVYCILMPLKPLSTLSHLFQPFSSLDRCRLGVHQKYVKVFIKWSKTMQTRDAVHILTLPRLVDKMLCPRSALKALQYLYGFDNHTPLFQWQGLAGSSPLIDSTVKKTLKKINMALGLNPSHFSFHNFHRSGATLAFNSHVPIQSIKRHGTWTSDCVYRYIQADQSSGEQLACALANAIDV